MDKELRGLIENPGDYAALCDTAGLLQGAAQRLIESHLLSCAPSAAPRVLHTLGTIAAGKSTYTREVARQQSNSLRVNFDDIMESIPAYADMKAVQGAAPAFAMWELPARAIGYEVLFRAAERRLDLIIDHTGSRADHVALLGYLSQKCGYHVTVASFDVSLDLAAQRAGTRDRFVPPHYIAERAETIAQLRPAYRAVADVYLEYEAIENGVAARA